MLAFCDATKLMYGKCFSTATYMTEEDVETQVLNLKVTIFWVRSLPTRDASYIYFGLLGQSKIFIK